MASEGPGRRGRAKRDQILTGARRVFLRDGFAGASTDAIAAEAGVSKRTLYAYYPSKEDLFVDVLRGLTIENPQSRVGVEDREHV
jgi:TetR/AcrR family transcriptional repressor of mexJK operon